jgi:hypothetical protein
MPLTCCRFDLGHDQRRAYNPHDPALLLGGGAAMLRLKL